MGIWVSAIDITVVIIIIIVIIILRKRVSQTPALAVDDLRLRRAGRAHNVHTLSTPPSPWGHHRHIFGIKIKYIRKNPKCLHLPHIMNWLQGEFDQLLPGCILATTVILKPGFGRILSATNVPAAKNWSSV